MMSSRMIWHSSMQEFQQNYQTVTYWKNNNNNNNRGVDLQSPMGVVTICLKFSFHALQIIPEVQSLNRISSTVTTAYLGTRMLIP